MLQADLHIHSRISDGSNSIAEIIRQAARRGLTHISLTDHDTVRGIPEALALGQQSGIKVIPGVEFSAFDYQLNVRTHILGYGMKNLALIEDLGSGLLKKRQQNSLRQIAILQELGYDLSFEAVNSKAGGCIYKQHIMHGLVEKGFAESIGGETFRRLFKNGGPCDFDITYLDAVEAITVIKAAGGISVLAHPGQQMNFDSIHRLKAAGLNALELNHHSCTTATRTLIIAYSRLYGLLLTGGSDHHGIYEVNSPEVGDYLCPLQTLVYLQEQ